MDGTCNTYGIKKKFIQILKVKLEGKCPLARTRHRREDNIKIHVRVWTGFIWLRIENSGGFLCTRYSDKLQASGS
jgi:hypothetical protein